MGHSASQSSILLGSVCVLLLSAVVAIIGDHWLNQKQKELQQALGMQRWKESLFTGAMPAHRMYAQAGIKSETMAHYNPTILGFAAGQAFAEAAGNYSPQKGIARHIESATTAAARSIRILQEDPNQRLDKHKIAKSTITDNGIKSKSASTLPSLKEDGEGVKSKSASALPSLKEDGEEEKLRRKAKARERRRQRALLRAERAERQDQLDIYLMYRNALGSLVKLMAMLAGLSFNRYMLALLGIMSADRYVLYALGVTVLAVYFSSFLNNLSLEDASCGKGPQNLEAHCSSSSEAQSGSSSGTGDSSDSCDEHLEDDAAGEGEVAMLWLHVAELEAQILRLRNLARALKKRRKHECGSCHAICDGGPPQPAT
eukprot:g73014.t1